MTETQTTQTQTDLTIANTIIAQMGGVNRLRVMTGAHTFVADENWVQFRFKGSRKANTCRVTYNYGLDLYTFELLQFSPTKMAFKPVYKLEGVYFDMLIDLFEQETGLYLSL